MRFPRRQFDRTTCDVGSVRLEETRPAFRFGRRGIVTRVLGPVLGCLLAVALLQDVQAQEEWTRFRGPDGTGISSAKSIPVTFGESDYRWNVELPGYGHSSPVLWGEKIFLTCEVREDNERFVVCLDAKDGRILWSHKADFEAYRQNKANSFAASTPAVDAKRVYVTWVSGTTFIVFALDHDGNEVWRRGMADYKSNFGAGVSPIVLDDVVIVANDHTGENCFLIGLDASSGETCWQVPRQAGMTSFITPAVYRPKDGPLEVVFVSPAHGITGIDPFTGNVNWELGGLFTQKTVVSPVIAGEIVFATSGQRGVGVEAVAVRRGDKASGRDPELVYSLDSALPYVPTAIVVGELMFVWHDEGIVTCVEAATGKQLWQERIGGNYFSSPICVDGRLYCVSKAGEVIVLEASAEYKLLARNQLPEEAYATPAVANGSIYFRTFNRLICVGGK